MHHEEYLVNIRLPPNPDTGSNMKIGQLSDLNLVVCYFTEILLTVTGTTARLCYDYIMSN